nr:MAG TPA: hypothetical protein [Caudoviricetes sp.]
MKFIILGLLLGSLLVSKNSKPSIFLGLANFIF